MLTCHSFLRLIYAATESLFISLNLHIFVRHSSNHSRGSEKHGTFPTRGKSEGDEPTGSFVEKQTAGQGGKARKKRNDQLLKHLIRDDFLHPKGVPTVMSADFARERERPVVSYGNDT